MGSFDRRLLGAQMISQDWLQKSGSFKSSQKSGSSYKSKQPNCTNTEIERYGYFSVLH
jgi:hypothetical protein